MKLVGFALLLALAFGCTSPMEAGHRDAGQGGTLPTAGGSGTFHLGSGGIGQGGSGALPDVNGSGGHVLVGTGGASGGVATSSGPGGSGGGPPLGTGGASGGVVTLPGSSGGGGSVGGTNGRANLMVSTAVINLGTIDLRTGGVGSVTVTNAGRAASGSVVVVASAGLVATGCVGTLPPGASCTLTIVATPTSVGTFTGTITISANPGAYPTPIVVAVVAIVGGELFTVSPTIIDLGPIPVGLAAPRQHITVTASVAVFDFVISTSGADVLVDRTATTCTQALAAGSSCVVAVSFLATTAGMRKDSVILTAGGANGTTIIVPITAVAQAPAKLLISPIAAAFTSVTGQYSTAVAFGVGNTGDMPTGAISATVIGPDAADFAITSNTCLVLASRDRCTLSVVFKPGPRDGGTSSTATLTVTDAGAGGSSVTASLSGTQYGPAALAIYPSTSDLGSVAVGDTGPATTFTLVNTGETSTDIVRFVVSTGEISITNDTCSGTALAAESGSCTFDLALKPTSAGAKAFTLRAVDATGVLVERTFTGVGVIP